MNRPVIIENSWSQYSPIEDGDVKERDGKLLIEPSEALGSDHSDGSGKAAKLSDLTFGEFRKLQEKGKVYLSLLGYDFIDDFAVEEQEDLVILRSLLGRREVARWV